MRRAVAAVLAALTVVVVAVGVVLVVRNPAPDDRRSTAAPKSTTPAATSPAAATPSVTATTAAPAASTPPAPRRIPACTTTTTSAFLPHSITVRGVTRRADVLALHRDSGGVPGTPPLTSYGKTVFAFDRDQGIEPGDPAGNVLLNAHTWPDGSALGNHLLAGLRTGDRIAVRGEGNAEMCYRVTERVEVLASKGLPRYYARSGPPQLAIVVCSGQRTGPGVWTHRTVWFASPQA